jgi:hypothetical protein
LTTEAPIAPAASEQPPVRPALHTTASLRQPDSRPFVRAAAVGMVATVGWLRRRKPATANSDSGTGITTGEFAGRPGTLASP